MPTLETLISLFSHYGYVLLFPLAIIEGPILAFLVGILIFLGQLKLVPSAIVLFLGDFVPDTIYYVIGYYADKKENIKRYTKKVGLTDQRQSFIVAMWHRHSVKTLFLSKLAYGLSTVFLITAGIARYPYRKFITGTMIVTILQYGVLISLGYYFSSYYAAASTYLKSTGIFVAFLAVAFIIIGYRKFSKKITQMLIETKE